jgi:hypothetical protein
MSFTLKTIVTVGNYKPLSVHAVSWERSIDNYSDTARITVPAVARMKRADGNYNRINTADQITPGMPVTILAGYDSHTPQRFKGFVAKVKYAIPLIIECEGYSWQLRNKTFTKSYGATSVKDILTDLVTGTDIKLSDDIPNIPLPAAVFKNVYGTQVLDWLKEKCLLTVYFIQDTLYAGGRSLQPFASVKFRIGWNTAAEEQLSYLTQDELARVIINANSRKEDGSMVIPITDLKGDVKQLRTLVSDNAALAAISEQATRSKKFTGYKGTLTAFALPYAEPGMTAVITDNRYPERSGRYFIQEVKGELGPQGGRQRIQLGYYVGAIDS